MDCFLGLDAGGTRTRWVLTDDSGEVLRRGEGPAIQAAVLGLPVAIERLMFLLAEILHTSTPASIVVGMAGAGDPAVRQALVDGLAASGCALPVAVVGDPEVAAGAALAEGPGVAVWSGTGSFVIARDAQGALHRCGGRGYLLGDQGSAYSIVRTAAISAVEALDGIGPETLLSKLLCEAFGLSSAAGLGAALQSRQTRDVAAQLGAVLTAVGDGDRVACQVLDFEARKLSSLVVAAVERAGLDPAATQIALGGGVFERAMAFAEVFLTRMHELGFVAAPLRGAEGECGAARLARATHYGEAPLAAWVRDGAS